MPQPSPEPINTPSYYNKAEFLAWFKFESIEQVPVEPNQILKGYSYCKVANFFKEQNKAFDMYNKKIVYSVDELWDQQRTVWFIRKYQRGKDNTNEIRLVNSKRAEPTNIDHDYRLCNSNSILWLSDLHFSDTYNDICYHNFPCSHDEANPNEPLSLVVDRALKDNHINTLAGVIISGDLTWASKKNEYMKAFNFCGNLISSYQLDRYQFAIIPGNHDIAFSDTPFENGSKITKSSEKATMEYRDFYNNFYYVEPSTYLYCVRKFLLKNLTPVEIICINSNVLQQNKEYFQGYGYVGHSQLEEIEEKMGWNSDESNNTKAIRILVLHHHLMPVTFSEKAKANVSYSVTLDSEEIVQFVIKHKIDIVLHGHMHEKFFAKVSRYIPSKSEFLSYNIIGNGSAGVISSQLPPNAKNMFTVLDFSNINQLIIKQIEICPDTQSKVEKLVINLERGEK